MGSTQPPEVDLPLGLSLDPSQDFLFMDPPDPAPGQPILTDNDTKLLSSFFEDMTSDNYNTTSFGEGLNFSDDWLNLPPQFMGTATSFGQQPNAPLEASSRGNPSASFNDLMTASSSMMPPPPPPLPTSVHSSMEQQASADVLAAAQLLQNGSMLRSSSSNHTAMFANQKDGVPFTRPPPVGHLRHQPMADFRQEDRRISQGQLDEHDNTFADMMFGASPHQVVAGRPGLPTEVQWGTDANFGRHFIPPSEKETREAMERETLSYMGCLEVNTSAANTRPSSPIHNGESSPLTSKVRNSIIKNGFEEDAEFPPKKRRKSKAKEDSEEPDADATTPMSKMIRKRKSKIDLAASQSPNSGGHEVTGAGKRRKSSAVSGAASKQARENLTEEQKRENHIKSEQKRRTLIKEGFDDLCDLVPGLKGGGFSKSTMLSMAGEWLEELMQGNEVLRTQLDELSELGGQLAGLRR